MEVKWDMMERKGRLYTGSVELTTLAKNISRARLFSKLSIKNRLSILPRVVRGGGDRMAAYEQSALY